MRKVRRATFETNSSSAHSLVLYKKDLEIDKESERYEIADKLFGSNFGLEYEYFEDEWDENNKMFFTEKDPENPFVWDFNRGRARYYNDTFNKIAFIIGYKKWKYEFDFDSLLDKIDKWFDEYSEFLNDRLIALKEKLIDNDFRNEKYRIDNISAEYEYDSNIIDKLLENDDLLKKFLFDSRSYISISGDEYDNFSLKCVGNESDYYNFYNGREEFYKRAEEVYDKEDYDITYGI